ncbi:MAG: hypothetical protein ABI616_05965 [Pseudomonadota bacterium]
MTAPSIATPAAPAAMPATSAAAAPMDAVFIERNQIIERYLSGKLPLKGAQDFERFCKDNPDIVIALGMSDRINQGLRLLEASGQPEPWAAKPVPAYQKPAVIATLAALAGTFLIASLMLLFAGNEKSTRIGVLEDEIKNQPLQAAQSTRTFLLHPSRSGPPSQAMATAGNAGPELADMKVDMAWSKFALFRVSIDRVDQGRVAVLDHMQKDSNGHLRIALNSSALGPGQYQVTVEALDWRGDATPEAWFSFAVAR